ncbi:MAG: protein kinase [Thermoanaerobaculia bacterium]
MRELGKGAMGIVYLGRDPVIGRLVALKTIRAVGDDEAEQREFGERFLREAQAAGILSHPNIVTIHDVGEDPDTHTSFIAMEYVEGKNLKQLVQEKTPYTFERIADIIGSVAEALDYAHRKGIVHRDVKPANIIITTEGVVKITDFGIAKIEQSNLTSTGQFLGTPNYMSPEQVTGDPVDGRSDLFSLGVCLYELLTRKKPFSGDNLTSISYKIVHEAFTPPEVYDANIPPEFGPALQKGLAKDPAGRFQRGNDFALSLYEFKARQEERQMLRYLGQMVAEAENLGGMSSVHVSPNFSSPAIPMPAAVEPMKEMGNGSGSRKAGASPAAGALIAAELSPPHEANPSFELGVAGGAGSPPPFTPRGDHAGRDVDVSAPDWTIEDVEIAPASSIVQSEEPAAPAGPHAAPSTEDNWWSEGNPEVVLQAVPEPEAHEPAPPEAPKPAPPAFDEPGGGLTERLDLRSALGFEPRKEAHPPTEFTERIPTQLPPAPATPAPSRANVFEDELENRPTEFIKDAAELARLGAPRPASITPSAAPPAPPNLKMVPEPPRSASIKETPREPKPPLRVESAASQGPTRIERIPVPLPNEKPSPKSTEKAAAEKSGPRPAPVSDPKQSTPATLKRHVSPKFVLLILGGVVVVGGLIVGVLLNQRSTIAKPAVPVEDELERETAERRKLMTDGEQLLKDGKPAEALKNFQELVRRSPSSAPAREALVRAEALAAAQQEGAVKSRQVEEHLAAAREASLVPDDAKAITEADAVLGVDPENAEAQTLKNAALERMSKKTLADQKKIKDEVAARKKLKVKPLATVPPVVAVVAPKAPEPVGVPSPTPTTANVRISFQSPIARGLLMIGLNDKIVFRKDFDFGKNGSGGLVDGAVSLGSGPGTLKVWLLATDRSFKPYKAFDLVVPGDAKSLRIELDGSNNFSVALR